MNAACTAEKCPALLPVSNHGFKPKEEKKHCQVVAIGLSQLAQRVRVDGSGSLRLGLRPSHREDYPARVDSATVEFSQLNSRGLCTLWMANLNTPYREVRGNSRESAGDDVDLWSHNVLSLPKSELLSPPVDTCVRKRDPRSIKHYIRCSSSCRVLEGEA